MTFTPSDLRAAADRDRLAAANAALEAQVARLVGALEFYANKEAWSQPPVRTREGLLSIEYENQASKVQSDRGKIARAALNMEAANG